MKYVQFPGASGSLPANTVTEVTLYQNNTGSYILIMGFSLYTPDPPSNSAMPWIYGIRAYITDPNNNMIDIVQSKATNVFPEPATIPIWNGTSVESETGSIPVVSRHSIDHVGRSMIPPLCSLKFSAYASGGGQSYSVSGGWGLALDEDELILLLVGKIK
ncbi:MAG: hypothetical protein QW478_10180 [Candidatus Micrarchaeaceae archaeon]